MGDLVTCIAVLHKGESLYLVCSPDFHLRILPCRIKGEAKIKIPEWEYEERGGRLHLTPSLLCLDTKFHTDYNWDCAFARCPEDQGAYEYFYSLNPNLKE